jgi:predicted nuclease of predicted toxin-antitoxin system
MSAADDLVIWNHARQHGFTVVSLDADFYDLSVLRGHPPKLIWLRCGNSAVSEVERRLRTNLTRIEAFAADTTTGCLEVF